MLPKPTVAGTCGDEIGPAAQGGFSNAFWLARAAVASRWLTPSCPAGGPRDTLASIGGGGIRGFGRLPLYKVAMTERAKASAIGPLPKGKGKDPKYWGLLSKIGQMRKEGWRGHQMLQEGFFAS